MVIEKQKGTQFVFLSLSGLHPVTLFRGGRKLEYLEKKH
jgi:hypothetical protein